MLYNSKDYGKAETEAIAKSIYVSSDEEKGVAPHPGGLFKLLETTDFMLLNGDNFLLLG